MTTETSAERPQIEQMVIIHRVFRREFGLLPRLVRGVADGDTARARLVADHANDVLFFLDVHHHGEDLLLWPVLLQRAELEAALIHRMESQHEAVGALIAHVQEQLPLWSQSPSSAGGAALTATFEALAAALSEHLGEEERQILPLVEQHLTAQEWNKLGDHGRSSGPPPQILATLAAILEEADDQERAMFISEMPPPVVAMFTAHAEPAYRERMQLVRSGG